MPKFGDWESEDNVPYSIVFENARKDKKGGKPNSSDLRDFSDSETPGKVGLHDLDAGHDESESMESVASHLHSNPRSRRTSVGSHPQRHDGAVSGVSKPDIEEPKLSVMPRHEHQLSQEEGDPRKPTDAPLHHDIAVRKSNNDSAHHFSGLSAGDTPKRATRHSAGSDRSSVEHSPLHPQTHARTGGKVSGVSSPSWERRGSSGGTHGLTPSTPERSRLRSVTRGDETPDNGPIIPKFGEWDENDPSSAEVYSQVFSKVREEKHNTGDGRVHVTPTEASSSTSGHRRNKNDNSKQSCGCIPWGRS
ncbi:hypothetical protein LIER_08984 [Lithospermum erythrorhizon]|uniref:RIN4 pathogenic type III effector avirulence factor Avr cleavage site domain-containing protein n=1 Tax=Lithospermum erythrorhizon TaxID=34254 RepID=A0AAV3PDW6_LITER